MSREERATYMRGYNAGSLGRWPAFDPPNPPQGEVLALFVAAKELREAALEVLRVSDPDDGPDGPFVTLQKEAAAVDAAFAAVSKWLLAQSSEEECRGETVDGCGPGVAAACGAPAGSKGGAAG